LSKIIKPSDKELFGSAKKFEKKPFAMGANPAKGARHSGNPSSSHKNNPGSKRGTKQTNTSDLVGEAELQAEQIVSKAESSAAQIREQAREQGRAEGLEVAAKKAEEQLQASSQMLDSLVAQLKAQETELMRLLSPRLASLATELAQKIIHREIEKDSSVVTTQAEEAISKILEREKLIIRVNPADEDLMKKHKAQLMKIFDGIEKIEVIADKKVERGGCVVETTLIKVDAQPSSQLEAARKTLLGEAEK
jgi:flagellar biosynthesis/type III secretory pathway protein FliH